MLNSITMQKIPIQQLTPAEYNPRVSLKVGDPMYEKLLRSVEEFGYVEPIIWNEQTGNVVGGHQRLKILQQLGWSEVDCVVVDIPEIREKALNIALNKISGEWDEEKLILVLDEIIQDSDIIDLTGYDMPEIDKLFDKLQKEQGIIVEDDFDTDAALAAIDEPIAQISDIWILGNHRLMCGDSTSADDVAKLMDGKKSRLIFTDPPWNVDYGGAAHPSWKKRTIMNDKMSTEEFYTFLLSVFKNMAAVSVAGCMTYVVMSAQEWHNLMAAMKDSNFHWSSTIIWYKDSLVLSRKDYHTQYEPIWYGWLQGEKRLCPLADRKQSDVWSYDRPKKSAEHPTMKPIALVGNAIKNSSHKDDIVLDLFGGSGTTLLAAEQTDRRAFLMELDLKFAEVIIRRFIKHQESDAGIFVLRDGERIAWHEIETIQNEEVASDE